MSASVVNFNASFLKSIEIDFTKFRALLQMEKERAQTCNTYFAFAAAASKETYLNC